MDSNLEACKLTFQIPQYKRWLAHLCRGYLLSSEQYCFCNTDPLGTYYVCAIFWSIFISSVLDWPHYFKCRSRFKPIFTYDRASCSFLIQVNCSDFSDCSLKRKEKKKMLRFFRPPAAASWPHIPQRYRKAINSVGPTMYGLTAPAPAYGWSVSSVHTCSNAKQQSMEWPLPYDCVIARRQTSSGGTAANHLHDCIYHLLQVSAALDSGFFRAWIVISSEDQQKDADAALLAAMVDSSMGMISLLVICAAEAGEKLSYECLTVLNL